MASAMNKKVKITKIGKAENALYDSALMQDYEAGKDNGDVSLPIEYYLEGYMLKPPTVGESLVVNRTSRNGIEIAGIFTTSEITEITEYGFKTSNSIYKLEYI